MSLFVKLLEAQKEIKHACKDSKNPHLKNKYASLNAVLDEVKPILNKNGLVLTQHVKAGLPGYVKVITRITEATSGESMNDDLQVPVKHKFKDGVDLGPDAQELGSAITYGRRYGLLAMCAIASEDDDGESAVGRSPMGSSSESRLERTDTVAPATPGPSAAKALTDKIDKAIGWTPLK